MFCLFLQISQFGLSVDNSYFGTWFRWQWVEWSWNIREWSSVAYIVVLKTNGISYMGSNTSSSNHYSSSAGWAFLKALRMCYSFGEYIVTKADFTTQDITSVVIRLFVFKAAFAGVVVHQALPAIIYLSDLLATQLFFVFILYIYAYFIFLMRRNKICVCFYLRYIHIFLT